MNRLLASFLLVMALALESWTEPAPQAASPPPAEELSEEAAHRDPDTHRPLRIDPDRPHVSEAPVVVGTGTVQIEAGVLSGASRSGEAHLTSTPTLVRIGTSTDTELRVESDVLNSQAGTLGFGDVSLGLKHVLNDEGVELAMLYTYKFNSGAAAFRSAAEPEIKLLIGFDLSDKTEVEINLGARTTVDSDTRERFGQGTFAVAVTHSLIQHTLAVFGEVYGDRPFLPGRGAQLTAQAGFLYRLDDDTQLDWEFLRGLSSSGLDWGIGIGVSTRY